MEFRRPRRVNPFDSPWLSLTAHGLATAALLSGCYFSIAIGAWWPGALALAAASALEIFWWYCLFRR
ncbi:hypothetical protein ABE85_09510 [Mitsuaria sp. 7]|nr:hypothetical protein ABE85_09510 [Mitsuaria sp. 7]